MILAHIGGVPFEEWLAPLAAGGSGLFLALRATFDRVRRRRSAPEDSPVP